MKLTGQQINLRRLKKSDAQSLYENAKDKKISRYTVLPYPYTLKDARSFIRRTIKNRHKKNVYELGMELKETGQIIGMVGLSKVNYKHKHAEIGYWLGKKHWRKGITQEGVKLVLDFGFNKLKLARIYARVLHPNIPSAKLLEKCGFKYEGCMRKEVFRRGKWLDDLRYGILKEEFRRLLKKK